MSHSNANYDLDDNPLLAKPSSHPWFFYGKLRPKHLISATKWLQDYAKDILHQVERDVEPTWENTMGLVDEYYATFHRIANPISHMISVSQDEEFHNSYRQVMDAGKKLQLLIKRSHILYQKLQKLRTSSQNWTADQQRALQIFLRDQVSSGVGLSFEKKEEAKCLEQRLMQLCLQFSTYMKKGAIGYRYVILDSNRLAGVPQFVKLKMSEQYQKVFHKAADEDTGPWLVTANLARYIFMYSECRDTRKDVYISLIQLHSEGEWSTTGLICEILNLRSQLAQIYGYPSYFEYIVQNSIASSFAEVRDFLLNMHKICLPYSEQRNRQLKEFHKSLGAIHPIEYWDRSFYEMKMKKSSDHDVLSSLREYLLYSHVLNGIFQLIEKLFSIHVRQVHDVPRQALWDENVQCFEVLDHVDNQADNQRCLGWIYIDPFSRHGLKKGGAWGYPMRNYRKHPQSKEVQLPVFYVMLNFNQLKEQSDALLEYHELKSLFHEFGHALHHIFSSSTEIPGYLGLHFLEKEFLEFPSQFMEHWCEHYDVVQNFAVHYRSGENLSKEQFDQFLAAYRSRFAEVTLSKISLFLLDITLHSKDGSWTIEEIFDSYHKILMKNQKDSHELLSDKYRTKSLTKYSQIFCSGYSSCLYGYLWAQLFSVDAFMLFCEKNIQDTQNIKQFGLRMRDTIFAYGASRNPQKMYRAFAGRDPILESLSAYIKGDML